MCTLCMSCIPAAIGCHINIWCVTLEILFQIPYHIWSTHKTSCASGWLSESILEEDWHCSSSEV